MWHIKKTHNIDIIHNIISIYNFERSIFSCQSYLNFIYALFIEILIMEPLDPINCHYAKLDNGGSNLSWKRWLWEAV